MAASTYSIYFVNQTGSDKTYGFFTDNPQVSDGVEVYSNVIESALVRNSTAARQSHWQIDVSETYFAWCGTAPSKLPGNNIQVQSADSALVTLASKSGNGSSFVMVNNNGVPGFDDNQFGYHDTQAGSFEISTGTDFTEALGFCYGLGSTNKAGWSIPVATVPAFGNSDSTFTPVVRFYIAAFNYQPGTVIDVKQWSKKAALIDFTGASLNGATVVHNPDGSFSVTPAQPSVALAMARQPPSPGRKSPTHRPKGSNRYAELSRIAKELEDAILSLDDQDFLPLYAASFTWGAGVTPANKTNIINYLATTVANNAGYQVNSRPAAPYNPPLFGIATGTAVATGRQFWAQCIAGANAQYGAGSCLNPTYIDGNFFDRDADAPIANGDSCATPAANGIKRKTAVAVN